MTSTTSSREKILVTGGLGFIGTHLVRKLHGEYDIIVIDWDDSPAATDKVDEWQRIGIKTYQADIAEPVIWTKLEQCDYVFHAAAQVSAIASEANPARDFQSNAFGTFLVAEYARAHSAAVIYCNSIRVYNTDAVDVAMRKYGMVSEDCATVLDSRRPHPPFAFSKYFGEQYLHQYARMYGMRVISHRMSGVVGSGQIGSNIHGWLTHLVGSAITGNVFTLYGSGEQSRDVLHIDDFINLITMELRDFEHFVEKGFAVYNIGGGPDNELSINQVISLLERDYGLRVSLQNEDARPNEPKHFVSDLCRISQKGWNPMHKDPKSIVDELVNWHRRRKTNAN